MAILTGSGGSSTIEDKKDKKLSLVRRSYWEANNSDRKPILGAALLLCYPPPANTMNLIPFDWRPGRPNGGMQISGPYTDAQFG